MRKLSDDSRASESRYLWTYVIGEELAVERACISAIQEILQRIDVKSLFDPATWRKLAAFVRVTPNGDILPTRAKYSQESNDYQVAMTHLYSRNNDPGDALWYALPDIAASVLLTGRMPKIIDAFRISAKGQLSTLKGITLREAVAVDPRRAIFFKSVIEERKRLASDSSRDPEERRRLDKAFKVLANSSYGLWAEMRREESAKKTLVTCYGIDPEPFYCRVINAEQPGEYCFPPIAALTTAGSRLLLALLERCIADVGGTFAAEDTDAMHVVSARRSGLIECPGGPYRKNGKPAIKALAWAQVDAIAKRFEQLNPYDRTTVPGSILKIEDDNFDPETGQQRQMFCLAISAKRYCCYIREHYGEPAVLRAGINSKEDRYSEHGLGHLLNPTDPESDDRSWIAQAWLNIVRRSLGLPTKPLGFEKRVAVGRITVSSPKVMEPLAALNAGKPYAEQIKPFNFIISCHVAKLGHPIGADPERFHLIAPYETDPRQWDKLQWIDQYSGKRYRITASEPHGSRTVARVKSYGDVLREYEFHPEAKCADVGGAPCSKQTVGLLGRRYVAIASVTYIGKESTKLEEVEEQSLLDPSDVYTEYSDPRHDQWATEILPRLKAMPLRELMEATGLPRSTLQAIRAGRRPHFRNAELLRRAISNEPGSRPC